MILKSLELNGFKSFGKGVKLDFDVPITAVVGPNGSGKSNVSEAIRWVLGEQSMKSLRGKRGEDLIFHGSSGSAQLGKARVSITFDNIEQTFPLDFSEVVISREVFRDGSNEYRINNSTVRLKDIIELLSNVGVGGTGHHIISQGEADRILYASLRDRKIMIEDALGLRIYHIKRAESERKLTATEENMREVGMLRREIKPHLRFLKEQAVKVEASKKIRDELIKALHIYFNREYSSLEHAKKELEEKERPLKEQYIQAEVEVKNLREDIAKKQSAVDSAMPSDIEEASRRLVTLEDERRVLERDMGRLEGQLAVLKRKNKIFSRSAVFSVGVLEQELQTLLSMISEVFSMETIEDIRKELTNLKQQVTQLLKSAKQKEKEEGADEERIALEHERDDLLHRLGLDEEEKKDLMQRKIEWEDKRREYQSGLFEDQKVLQAAEEKAYVAKDALRSFEFTREQIRVRTDEFNTDKAEASPLLGSSTSIEDSSFDSAGDKSWSNEQRAKEKQLFQRLRIKLEEVGGINPEVLKEFKEVQERDAFLLHELEDLESTAKSLHALMSELDQNLAREFSEGVAKINKEFTQLFEAMFDGGGAKLKLTHLHTSSIENDDSGDEKDGSGDMGIDVAVDIPKKRVKNLDMLSGGERALTSIALLFAMSFVNPPPFLILDETDAALDEANSGRYGAMLRNLSEKTQLIVITHNRQTMKEASVLYGVTMGSDGVSRLLSLKFEEATKVSGPPHSA